MENSVACSITIDVKATFTSDINLLNVPGNAEVEQQVELTKSAKVIEEAMEAFDQGDMEHGQKLLKTQADQMLQVSVTMNSPGMAEENIFGGVKYFSLKRCNVNYSISVKYESSITRKKPYS